MPFHLYAWVGPRPRDDDALAQFSSRDPVTSDAWPPPSAAMSAFIDDLVRVYPVPPDEGSEDSPWAWSPLRETASGDTADLTLTWSGYRRASLVIAGVAARHGVVCLDTESGRIVDPPQLPVLPLSGPSHTRLLRHLGEALAPQGFTTEDQALELPTEDGLLVGVGLQGLVGEWSRAVWVSIGLVDAQKWADYSGRFEARSRAFDPSPAYSRLRHASTRIGWLMPDPHDHAWRLDDDDDLWRCVEQATHLVRSGALPHLGRWSAALRAGDVQLTMDRSKSLGRGMCSLSPCGAG